MLRDKSLIPLSHQHQHALALCVRLDRALLAGEVNPEAWRTEIEQIFDQEIGLHFAAEEKEVFPAASRYPELKAVVDALVGEHTVLRDLFVQSTSRTLDAATLRTLSDTLSGHIRKEERQLFEGMQKLMSKDELAGIGKSLEQALGEASETCLLPNEATRLRPKSQA
jgi:hemerythrin-like domain-containing protein